MPRGARRYVDARHNGKRFGAQWLYA